jgi:hypothetical protein
MSYQTTGPLVDDFRSQTVYAETIKSVNLTNLNTFKSCVDQFAYTTDNALFNLGQDLLKLKASLEKVDEFYAWFALKNPDVINAFLVERKIEKANENSI